MCGPVPVFLTVSFGAPKRRLALAAARHGQSGAPQGRPARGIDPLQGGYELRQRGLPLIPMSRQSALLLYTSAYRLA